MNTIAICNAALAMLGIPAITSFEENNANAKLCRALFPALRDRVLRDHPWSFATRYHDLPILAQQSPDPEYPFAAHLPGDIIRIIRLIPRDIPYQKSGRTLLLAEPAEQLVYTAKITDSELFDDLFTEALQYLMAAEIGMANTRDAQLISMYRNEYMQRLAVARSIDSAENRHFFQSRRRSDWLAARFGASIKRPHRVGSTEWVEGTEGKQVRE